MALTEQKLKTIDMLINGEPITNIAKIIGVRRATIYDWKKDPEFRAEQVRRETEIKAQGEQEINKDLHLYIAELKKIALTDKSSKIRSDTAQYLIDRVLGRTTSKIADVTNDNEDNDRISSDELTNELDEFKGLIKLRDSQHKVG